MAVLTMTDVGDLVRRMNKLYQPDGLCSDVADVKHMQELVSKLRDYTNQVQEEADSNGYAWISSSIFTPAATDSENMSQWISDMANWRQRLSSYQAALDGAEVTTGIESCREIYGTVIGPLLDGNFSNATDPVGIVNPRVPSVNDIATPYMLGNQIKVWQEFQRENFEALVGYLIDEAKDVARRVRRAARSAAPDVLKIGLGLGIAALGIGFATGRIGKRR